MRWGKYRKRRYGSMILYGLKLLSSVLIVVLLSNVRRKPSPSREHHSIPVTCDKIIILLKIKPLSTSLYFIHENIVFQIKKFVG